ncbi:synaptobrevin-B [Lachnospiraceae bacterium 54-53]
MINFNNKNNRKFLSGVLIFVVILLIVAMVLPMMLTFI